MSKHLRAYAIYCEMQEERDLEILSFPEWYKEQEEAKAEAAATNKEIDNDY